MSNQPQCKVKGCERTAIPGKSPHGLCLRHEAEIEKGILKMTCKVKGCGALFKPFEDNVPMCPECRNLTEKVWWILQFTQPMKEEAKLIVPGKTGLGGISMTEAMKKLARAQGGG